MRRSSNIWSPKRWFKMWKCCIRYHDVFSLTCVFRVADGKRALLDLLLKQVLFVEEQDDGRVCEPLVVADAVKQLHALMHSVLKAKHRKEAISSAIHKRRDPDMIHLRFSIYHHFCLQRKTKATTDHLLILGQHQVVIAQRHAEDDGRHALKAVDPLLPLGSLTADVEHSDGQTAALAQFSAWNNHIWELFLLK